MDRSFFWKCHRFLFKTCAGVGLLLVIFIWIGGLLYAQESAGESEMSEGQWVTLRLTRLLSENISLAEAKQRLRETARKRAVEKAIRLAYTVSNLFVDQMAQIGSHESQRVSELNFVHYIAYGHILDEEISYHTNSVGQGRIDLTIAYKAKVIKSKGLPDPGFRVSCTPERRVFQEGDQLSFSIRSTKDCYITVLNIAADNHVHLWFPNEISKNSFLRAGTEKVLPDKKMKEQGIGIVLHGLPDRKVTGEMVLVVATLSQVPFIEDAERIVGRGNVGNLRVAWLKFQRWLAPIPLENRAEASFIYQIFR